MAQVLVFGGGAFALELLGFYLAILQVLVDDFKRQRQVDIARVIQAVEDVYALDRAVFAMVEVPCDDFVFIAVGLFLDGVVEDQRTVIRFDSTDGRFDQCPQLARGVFVPRQKTGDLIMAVLVVQQQGQAGCGDQRERTDQIIAVQL